MITISKNTLIALLFREFGLSPNDLNTEFITKEGVVVDLKSVKFVVKKGPQLRFVFSENVVGDLMAPENLRLFISELFEVFGPSKRLLNEFRRFHLRYVWQVLIAYESLLEAKKLTKKSTDELLTVLNKIPGYSDYFRSLFVDRFLTWAKGQGLVVGGNPLDWLGMLNDKPVLIQNITDYIFDNVTTMQKEM